jgi:hypothetical protein
MPHAIVNPSSGVYAGPARGVTISFPESTFYGFLAFPAAFFSSFASSCAIIFDVINRLINRKQIAG